MKTSQNLIIATLSIIPIASAEIPAIPASTSSACVTSRATKSVNPVPTSNKAMTVTLPKIVVTTSTPSVVITPTLVTSISAITNTATSTLTLPQTTNTETDTKIVTDTALSTGATITVTSTGTSTVVQTSLVTSTTTAAIAGFKSSQQSLSEFVPAKKREVSRPERGILSRLGRGIFSRQRKPTKSSTPSYPAAVKCYTLVKSFAALTVTKTAKTTTTTTLKAVTATVTTTTVTTITETAQRPLATTTITSTSTTTTTSITIPTSTVTQTPTVTVEQTAATQYAQCSANNQISSLNGSPFVDISIDGNGYANFNDYYYYGAALDANSCCNSCFQFPNTDCSAFMFYYGTCYFIVAKDSGRTPSTCAPVNRFSMGVDLGRGTAPGPVSVGNAYCARWDYTFRKLEA